MMCVLHQQFLTSKMASPKYHSIARVDPNSFSLLRWPCQKTTASLEQTTIVSDPADFGDSVSICPRNCQCSLTMMYYYQQSNVVKGQTTGQEKFHQALYDIWQVPTCRSREERYYILQDQPQWCAVTCFFFYFILILHSALHTIHSSPVAHHLPEKSADHVVWRLLPIASPMGCRHPTRHIAVILTSWANVPTLDLGILHVWVEKQGLIDTQLMCYIILLLSFTPLPR